MKNIVKLNDFVVFLREFLWEKPVHLFLIIFTLLLGFGVKLTTISYNNDLADGFFSQRFRFLDQKRWGCAFYSWLGLTDRNIPFWSDCLGLFFLLLGALLLAFLLKKISKDRFNYSSLIVFILLFISYPLRLEFGIYPSGLLVEGICYCEVAFALILISEIRSFKEFLSFRGGISMLILGVAFSSYESFMVVYIVAVCLIVFCKVYMGQIKTFSQTISELYPYIGASIGGLLCRFGVLFLLWMAGFRFSAGGGAAAKEILWLNGETFLVFVILIKGLLYSYVYNAMFYFALFVFILTCAFGLILALKKNNRLLLLFILGTTIFFIFSLSFILGSSQPYRICQSMSLFVGIIWLLLWQDQKQFKKVLFVGVCLTVLLQTKEMSLFLTYDHLVSEKTRADIVKLGTDIKSQFGADPEKEVIIVGQADLWEKHSDMRYSMALRSLYRFHRHQVFPYAGRGRFNSKNFVMYSKLERWCDLKIPRLSNEDRSAYSQIAKKNKQHEWPCDGYIKEYDNCIIVNLGLGDEQCESESGK